MPLRVSVTTAGASVTLGALASTAVPGGDDGAGPGAGGIGGGAVGSAGGGPGWGSGDAAGGARRNVVTLSSALAVAYTNLPSVETTMPYAPLSSWLSTQPGFAVLATHPSVPGSWSIRPVDVLRENAVTASLAIPKSLRPPDAYTFLPSGETATLLTWESPTPSSQPSLPVSDTQPSAPAGCDSAPVAAFRFSTAIAFETIEAT